MKKSAQFYQLDRLPFEKINDKGSRCYVYGDNAMHCYFLLKKGAVMPEHQHESEEIT